MLEGRARKEGDEPETADLDLALEDNKDPEGDMDDPEGDMEDPESDMDPEGNEESDSGSHNESTEPEPSADVVEPNLSTEERLKQFWSKYKVPKFQEPASPSPKPEIPEAEIAPEIPEAEIAPSTPTRAVKARRTTCGGRSFFELEMEEACSKV